MALLCVYVPRFTYNVDNGACEPYMYGGCNGSDNLYLTEEECIKTCIKADITVPASWSRYCTIVPTYQAR